MQLLLSTSIPSPLQDTSGDINGAGHGYGQYVRACGNLLNLFGHTSGLNLKTTVPSVDDLAEDPTYQALVKVVGESVLQVANILHIHKLVRRGICRPVIFSLTWPYYMTLGCSSVWFT
jgi:hypothetical protein